MPPLRVLVTRPQPQADQWTQRLCAEGVAAESLPLLATAPAAADALAAAWRDMAGDALAVFVSPAAVAHFAAARPPGAPWPQAVAAPGPGTAAALLAEGVPPAQLLQPADDAEQFDSESLWQVLRERDWHGRRVSIVRGGGGRDWLADQLRAAGAELRFVPAYCRAAPRLDPAQRALLEAAVAEPQAHLWLFSSSQAIDELALLAPDAAWAPSRALASHPRIAERARQLGFGSVEACSPRFDAVLQALQGMQAQAWMAPPPRGPRSAPPTGE